MLNFSLVVLSFDLQICVLSFPCNYTLDITSSSSLVNSAKNTDGKTFPNPLGNDNTILKVQNRLERILLGTMIVLLERGPVVICVKILVATSMVVFVERPTNARVWHKAYNIAQTRGRVVAQIRPSFPKCLGFRRQSPIKGCLRGQAINLAFPERFRAKNIFVSFVKSIVK